MFFFKVRCVFVLIAVFFSFEIWSLDYVKNEGQWHENVLYKTKMVDGGNLFLENNVFTFAYYNSSEIADQHQSICKSSCHPTNKHREQRVKMKAHAFKLSFLNAHSNPTIVSSDKQAKYHNYFIGNDKSTWKGKVPVYEQITYESLYDGIDVQLYGVEGVLKYDYIVHPQADIAEIQLKYEGLDGLYINNNKDLVLKTSVTTITESAPYAYQIINGMKTEVVVNFKYENGVVSFDAPNGYDKNHTLIIDPTLLASTYTGSTADNFGFTATYDNDGNMYAGGIAFGVGYPTSLGAYDETYNGLFEEDIALSKFSSNGEDLIWSTYIGGDSIDNPHSIIVNNNNELIVYGSSRSSNIPRTTGNPHQGLNDIYMAMLNDDATDLINARLYGGPGEDGVNYSSVAYNYGDFARGDLEIAPNGDIIIASISESTTLPNTNGQIQNSNNGGSDGLVVRFSPNLSNIKWATFFGGSNDDSFNDLEVEIGGTILLTGGTNSSDLVGFTGLYNTYQGGQTDGYVLRLTGNGNQILNGSYIGTSDYDQTFFVDTDTDGNVYLFGQTTGNYPIANADWSEENAPQFIHKLNPTLSNTIYSTVFGSTNSTSPDISPTAFLVDKCENIYAMGFGGFNSLGFGGLSDLGSYGDITPPFNTFLSDGFYLFVLAKDATDALFGARIGDSFGGDHVDGGTSRFDPNGYVYHAVCASCQGNDGFPTTTNAYSNTNNSDNCNLAVFKLEFELAPLNVNIGAEVLNECVPATVNFTNQSNKPFDPDQQTLMWDFGDGNTALNVNAPTHTYQTAGIYEVTLIVTDSSDCNLADTASLQLEFFPSSVNFFDTVVICDNETYTLPNGVVVSEAGNYSGNIDASCDTNLVIVVNVLPTFDIINLSYSCFPADTFTNTTVYTSQLGCDSTVTTKVALAESNELTINLGSCFPADTGMNVLFLTNQFNCDSTVTVYTSLYPSYDTTIFSRTCFPSDSGIFVEELVSQFNCDSIVTSIVTLTDFELISYQVDSSNCLNQNGGIQISFTGGIAPYQYSIAEQNGSIDTTYIALDLLPGNYSTVVTDAEGCSFTFDFTVFKIESVPLEVFPEYTELFLGDSVSFSSSPNTGSFSWATPFYLSCNNCPNPTALPGDDIIYYIQRIDDIGCITIDSVFIFVEHPEVFVPSAFTPNNDGLNDDIGPIKKFLEDIDIFRIYNRYGEIVFETDDIDEAWDGVFKNEMQEMDNYVYYLRARLILSRRTIELEGDILLIH